MLYSLSRSMNEDVSLGAMLIPVYFFALFMIGIDMPDTSTDGAVRRAERIRRDVAGTFPKTQDHELSVTISLGVAASEGWAGEIERLVHESDMRLHEAKRSGRNMVVASNRESRDGKG
jgi:diguanylate cyclase (GGDEF)-like protein